MSLSQNCVNFLLGLALHNKKNNEISRLDVVEIARP